MLLLLWLVGGSYDAATILLKKKVCKDLVYGRKYSWAFVVLAFFEEVVD